MRNLEEPLGNYKNEFQRISYTEVYIIDNIEDGSILLSENKNYKLDRLNNKEYYKFINGGTNEENLAQYTLGNIDIYIIHQ